MKKPNILWICTDQQRADTLGCYGNTVIETPNLDRLANHGVMFERAYCQCPVCAPSRASFLTGRYPRTCRLRQNGQKIPAEEKLVTALLRDSGYVCGLSGKLHLAPCDPGLFPGTESRTDDGYSVFYWSHHPNPDWGVNEYTLWLQNKGMEYKTQPYCGSAYVEAGMPEEYHHSTFCTEKAAAFIKTQSGSTAPWLFSVNFFDPHHSFDPPEELTKKYAEKFGKKRFQRFLWDEKGRTSYQKLDHAGAYNMEGHFPYDAMEDKEHILVQAAYAAMVELIDHNVGKLISALEESGQLNNTVIIFTSDHGEMLGDHGIYLKGPYFYEELIRVPLIFSCPGMIRENVRASALTELVDIAPTLMEMAGLVPDPGMQGISLKNLLTNPPAEDHVRESVYCEYYNSMPWHKKPQAQATMVSDGKYKLVRYHSSGEGELYNLQKDPKELVNLWDSEKERDVKLEMIIKLADRMAWTMDPLPQRESAW